MSTIPNHARARWATYFTMGVLSFVAFTLGAFPRQPAEVQAEVQKAVPRTAFKSGSERSLVILREIAGTLKRIDARIERIEKLAADANGQDAAK